MYFQKFIFHLFNNTNKQLLNHRTIKDKLIGHGAQCL